MVDYIHKPIRVDAFYYTGFDCIPQLAEFLNDTNYSIAYQGFTIEFIELYTLSGNIFTAVNPSQWIVKDKDRKIITKYGIEEFNRLYTRAE